MEATDSLAAITQVDEIILPVAENKTNSINDLEYAEERKNFDNAEDYAECIEFIEEKDPMADIEEPNPLAEFLQAENTKANNEETECVTDDDNIKHVEEEEVEQIDEDFILESASELEEVEQIISYKALTATEETEQHKQLRSGANKEEAVDEHQCRVCTGTDDLVSLFDKIDKDTPADMLMIICPSVSIAEKDFMPQFICNSCLDNVTIAIQLKIQLEITEKELRKKLSRSKNKIRRPPKGYIVIDAPDSESQTEDEANDDVEFKVSDENVSTSADTDSEDSDISDKPRRGPIGKRRRRRNIITPRFLKRDHNSEGNAEEVLALKKANITAHQFRCEHCDQTFERKQSYVQHKKVHDNCEQFICDICNKKFKLKRAFLNHRSRHDDHFAYECKKCLRRFVSEMRLKRHTADHCRGTIYPSKSKKNCYETAEIGKDLFKSVAPLTTTYWSDSFSD